MTRIEKERQHMPLFEKFITGGNENADEPAKEGAMEDGCFMAQARASTIQQEREDVYAALQWERSFHCLVSVHEMWKRQQVCVDTRNMCGTDVVGEGHRDTSSEAGEGRIWEDTTW